MGSLGRAAVPAAWSDSGSCTNRDSTMMLRLMLPVMLVSCLAGTSMGAQINRERRGATFGAIVGGLASPFINFKQGVLNLLGGAKAPKKPSKPAPKPSYGAPAPSYHAPAPSYHAPAPSYSAPVPSYDPPAPSYSAPAAPAYEPPAPKPEIQILPAPDLSQLAPAAPAEDTYGSPAAAPAVYAYDAPAAAPDNEDPAEAVDSYGSPVLPTYVVEPEAPAQPPVYEPATYEPAPVEYVPVVLSETSFQYVPAPAKAAPAEPAPAQTDPVKAEPAVTDPAIIVDITGDADVASVVDVKAAEVVGLRAGEDGEEPREPKAFSEAQPSSNAVETEDEKPIVIDLTDSFSSIASTTETIQTTENTPEVVVIEEVKTEKPIATQIITFEAVEEIPALSEPVDSADEVVSISPSQDAEVRNIEFTPVQNDPQIDTFTDAPEAATEAVAVTEIVTPIVPDEELRSVVVELDSAPLEIADIEEVDVNEVEVIDLRTDKKSSGLTILDHDEDHPEVFVVVDETTTTALPVTTQSQDILDIQEEELAVDEDEIIKESDTDFSLVNAVETSPTPVEIAPAKEPELRRVTFQILSDEEAENVNPEVTFRIVDPVNADENTFDTFKIVETTTDANIEEIPLTNTNIGEIPATIGSDPVFQEIVKTSEDNENVKRGYNAYDPRHRQVYAHKYNDKYSNWYYFRKGY